MSSNPATKPVSPVVSFLVNAGSERLGKSLYVVGDEVFVKISSRDTNGAFTLMDSYTLPQAGPPLHMHYDQDEWFYVLEGEFLFEVNGERTKAGPGGTVFAARGTQHTFQNIGNERGRMLIGVVPGGLDIFFEELSQTVPPGAVPDPVVMSPLFRKHGLELLGPPLGAREKK